MRQIIRLSFVIVVFALPGVARARQVPAVGIFNTRAIDVAVNGAVQVSDEQKPAVAGVLAGLSWPILDPDSGIGVRASVGLDRFMAALNSPDVVHRLFVAGDIVTETNRRFCVSSCTYEYVGFSLNRFSAGTIPHGTGLTRGFRAGIGIRKKLSSQTMLNGEVGVDLTRGPDDQINGKQFLIAGRVGVRIGF